jgi:SPP1 family predicted phage head-tail adaptor
MPLGAGAYPHTVAFEAPAEVNHGQETPNWTPYLTCKASVKPLRGREAVIAKQVRPEQMYVVTIRHTEARFAAISPDHRVNFKGRLLHIEARRNVDEANREIEVDCVEIPGEQP